MANEFKLSYTAADINARLGKIDGLATKSELPTKLSDLVDDSDFADKIYVQDYAQPIGDYALKIDYDESIIGLSVDGQTVTYIKGDGSVHTFITQDTDTTYSLGTDEITGLTKLYATIGNAEDGTMTQKAIKTELDKKVGVSIDDVNDMLVFTI